MYAVERLRKQFELLLGNVDKKIINECIKITLIEKLTAIEGFDFTSGSIADKYRNKLRKAISEL